MNFNSDSFNSYFAWFQNNIFQKDNRNESIYKSIEINNVSLKWNEH